MDRPGPNTASSAALRSALDELSRTVAAQAGATPEEQWEAQFDAGLAWPDLPVGDGGLGLDTYDAGQLHEALASIGLPAREPRHLIGMGMGGPTVARHGTAQQREARLRRAFSGRDIWCQMFSEPGAGSDLAGLSTVAMQSEAGWVVNGQKVWTSFAHVADWGMLLARTDADAPKHRGLSYFIVDMRTPGIEVRPLFQITGEAEFNEVYFTDVVLPPDSLVGEVGDGWRIALTTLMNERVTIAANAKTFHDPVDQCLEIWRESKCDDPLLRDRLLSLCIRSRLTRHTLKRSTETRGAPGPEGSIGKLLWAEYMRDVAELLLDLQGRFALVNERGYPLKRAEESEDATRDPAWLFLRTRANTIEGGTSEILRSLIAERVLGLPPEIRTDKDKPWREVPRG